MNFSLGGFPGGLGSRICRERDAFGCIRQRACRYLSDYLSCVHKASCPAAPGLPPGTPLRRAGSCGAVRHGCCREEPLRGFQNGDAGWDREIGFAAGDDPFALSASSMLFPPHFCSGFDALRCLCLCLDFLPVEPELLPTGQGSALFPHQQPQGAPIPDRRAAASSCPQSGIRGA